MSTTGEGQQGRAAASEHDDRRTLTTRFWIGAATGTGVVGVVLVVSYLVATGRL